MQRLRRDLTSEKHARLLDMITNATNRGESLTRQVLAFSSRQMLNPSVIDLAQRLPELKEMLNRSLRGDVTTEVVVPEGAARSKSIERVRARLAQSRGQRPRCHAPRWIADHSSRGRCCSRARRRKRDCRASSSPFACRHRRRDSRRRAASRVRAVLHDQAGRRGHGPGAQPGLRLRQAVRGTATITSTVGRGTVITLYLPRTRELPRARARGPSRKPRWRRLGPRSWSRTIRKSPRSPPAYFQQLGYLVKQAANRA